MDSFIWWIVNEYSEAAVKESLIKSVRWTIPRDAASQILNVLTAISEAIWGLYKDGMKGSYVDYHNSFCYFSIRSSIWRRFGRIRSSIYFLSPFTLWTKTIFISSSKSTHQSFRKCFAFGNGRTFPIAFLGSGCNFESNWTHFLCRHSRANYLCLIRDIRIELSPLLCSIG